VSGFVPSIARTGPGGPLKACHDVLGAMRRSKCDCPVPWFCRDGQRRRRDVTAIYPYGL